MHVCGTKPEYLEKTYVSTRRTCKLHTESLLWVNSANQHGASRCRTKEIYKHDWRKLVNGHSQWWYGGNMLVKGPWEITVVDINNWKVVPWCFVTEQREFKLFHHQLTDMTCEHSGSHFSSCGFALLCPWQLLTASDYVCSVYGWNSPW